MNDYSSPNYFTAWRRAFDFLGDSTRTEYWSFTLINIVIGFALGLAFAFTGGQDDGGGISWVFALLGLVFFLAIIIPGISVTIRRVRDATGSGWWTLLALVPFVGGLIILIISLMPTSRR